jgi:hypothetical protein
VPGYLSSSGAHLYAETGAKWQLGDIIEVSKSQLQSMPKEWFSDFVVADKQYPARGSPMTMEYAPKYDNAPTDPVHGGKIWEGHKHTAHPMAELELDEKAFLNAPTYAEAYDYAVKTGLLGDVHPAMYMSTSQLEPDAVQPIAQVGPNKKLDKLKKLMTTWSPWEEQPKHPMKHGLKDPDHELYWNAHCQHWQKYKPVSLSGCQKAYGKGPFVHGYHAPAPPAGFSVGTGMGYWHADKKTWLKWEPEPLDAPEPGPGNWVKKKSAKVEVGGPLASYHGMEQEGFNKTIQQYVPDFKHDTLLPVKNLTVESDFAGNVTKMTIMYQGGTTHEVTLSAQELEEQS